MAAQAEPGKGTELPSAGVDSIRGQPREGRDAFTLWSPWRLRTARSPFQRTGKARKGLERIAEDAPQLPHGPRRFCRDQVPASVTATESLHGGRARPCPATRSCFPGTSSLTAPVRTRESPGSRSPAPGVATAPSTGRASRGRSTDPPGH